MEILAFIKAREADHLLRTMLRGLPIWARRHRPVTPDRCQHPSLIGDYLETLAWGEPSIDVERAVTDAMFPAELLGAYPGLVLFQNANDLLFAETAFPHRLSPRLENRLTSNRGLFRGAGHARRIKEKHERELAMEVARQEDSARKRRAVMAELLEAWLDEADDAAAGAFLLELAEYASVSEEKLLATHPRFPGNA